jgi:hypothetical protein
MGTTSKLSIINRGLQHLGEPSLSNVNENSPGGKAMRAAYDSVLLAALRKRVWRFAVKRASLAADATPPLFGKARQFPLPGDWVRMAPDERTYGDPASKDWEIEGSNILTDDQSPLQIRYVSNSVTESSFDALFAEHLSLELAMACCEQITNSNTKLANLAALNKEALAIAAKTNSMESAPAKSPQCSWITVRY